MTVIDKKLYPELQEKYCAESNSGACPCYNVGDEFIFEREDGKDDFWHMGLDTLVKTNFDKTPSQADLLWRIAPKRGMLLADIFTQDFKAEVL